MRRLFNIEDGTVTGYGDVLAQHVNMIVFDDEMPGDLERCQLLRRARQNASNPSANVFQQSFESLEAAATALRNVYVEQQPLTKAVLDDLDPDVFTATALSEEAPPSPLPPPAPKQPKQRRSKKALPDVDEDAAG